MLRGGESDSVKTKDELEEEIVLEILREGRGDREEKGERDEWNQHIGWNRKENVGQLHDHEPLTERDKQKDPAIRQKTNTAGDHGSKLRGHKHEHAELEKDLGVEDIKATTSSQGVFQWVTPAVIFLGLVVGVWWNSTRRIRRNTGRRWIRNRNTKGRTL
mmetsp:Transcript_14150/g.35540  ORF Transcript_14150/g.35540 Transcript_14150/m.35540 type:complete len:160 (-) Transcript_14150:421-900(-)